MKLLHLVGLTLALGCSIAFAAQASSDATKEIENRMMKLRSMPDSERAKETKALALKIRALPASDDKVLNAHMLANLSTEGDFGRDTLQEVANTLAQALREAPQKVTKDSPDPYMELAQLEKYEGMKVSLSDANYAAAKLKVDEIDKERARADFTLTDLSGKSWTRSALKGKVVLVNFWATWCPPCRKEMPDLQSLYERFKSKGFVILAISDEPSKTVQPFIDQHNYSYPILLDPGRKINDLYKVDGIPKSFIYDRNGKLVAQTIDMRTMGQFLELLAKAGLK